MNGKVIRIGGASGFWGDSSVGAPQLVRLGQVDYLVFDYLAELTMSILAAARAKDPALGYATYFVTVTMKTILKDVAAQGIRVISKPGGVNLRACAGAVAALAAEQGLRVTIAMVQGDDVIPLVRATIRWAKAWRRSCSRCRFRFRRAGAFSRVETAKLIEESSCSVTNNVVKQALFSKPKARHRLGRCHPHLLTRKAVP